MPNGARRVDLGFYPVPATAAFTSESKYGVVCCNRCKTFRRSERVRIIIRDHTVVAVLLINTGLL